MVRQIGSSPQEEWKSNIFETTTYKTKNTSRFLNQKLWQKFPVYTLTNQPSLPMVFFGFQHPNLWAIGTVWRQVCITSLSKYQGYMNTSCTRPWTKLLSPSSSSLFWSTCKVPADREQESQSSLRSRPGPQPCACSLSCRGPWATSDPCASPLRWTCPWADLGRVLGNMYEIWAICLQWITGILPKLHSTICAIKRE